MRLGTVGILTMALALCAARELRAQCGNSIGRTPLSDLGAGTYNGFTGGLYGGGSNMIPPGHLAHALQQAAAIVPRDAQGQPDAGCGLIGMISIGMSNTTHEWGVFERQEDLNAARNPRVVIFNGAQGGQDATILQNPSATYWTLVDQRVAAVGLTNAQVEVAWLKEALSLQLPYQGFPAHAQTLQSALGDIVRILHDKFPNLRLCYLSSRIYGGYGGSEPASYETGFAVRWLIEDQIAGNPALNWDPSAGTVESPLCLWGPYLWADGQTPRSDGLQWCQSDIEGDGTHPAPGGEQKVANLLSAFFAADATAQPWYANAGLLPLAAVDTHADATVLSTQPATNFGADVALRIENQPQIARAYLKFDFSAVRRPVLHAKLSMRNPEQNLNSGTLAVALVNDTTWTEGAITYANAPPTTGTPLSSPGTSRDGGRQVDVTNWVNADPDGVLSLALIGSNPTFQAALVRSRDSGQAPRLVFSLAPGGVVTYCTAKTNSLGCLPSIDWSGAPSSLASSGFVVKSANVRNNKPGLLLHGVSGRAATPFTGGTLCIAAPVRRSTGVVSGGNPSPADDCSGIYALDMNAFAAGALGGNPLAALSVPGTVVDCEWWGRDNGFTPPDNTALSNALEYVVCD